DRTSRTREVQRADVGVQTAKKWSQCRIANVERVGVDVARGREPGEIVEIEVDGERAADAVVSHTETAANHALAFASENFAEKIVAEVRRPGERNRRRPVVPILFV